MDPAAVKTNKKPALENPRCEVDIKVLMPEAWQRCISTGGAPCREAVSPPRQEDAHLLHLVCASPTPVEGCSACTLLSCLVQVPFSGNPVNVPMGFPARGRDPRGMAVGLGDEAEPPGSAGCMARNQPCVRCPWVCCPDLACHHVG